MKKSCVWPLRLCREKEMEIVELENAHAKTRYYFMSRQLD